MDYWHSLTVETGYTATTPYRETMKVCPGVVKQVWLFFPQGHVGTTKVRILRGEHQVWPTNPGGWYLGDNTVIQFPENYELRFESFEFVIEGYNTSLIYPHTAYIRLTILPPERPFVPILSHPVEVVW